MYGTARQATDDKIMWRRPDAICMQVGCVHTNRVESSPIQSSPDSQRRGSDSMAYFQWPPRQCVHASRVESSRAESHESCRVKRLNAACSIFVSQTLVIGRDGCYLEEEMDMEKLILLVTDHEEIFDASRCEHRNRD